jgi:hypothetical protein
MGRKYFGHFIAEGLKKSLPLSPSIPYILNFRMYPIRLLDSLWGNKGFQ